MTIQKYIFIFILFRERESRRHVGSSEVTGEIDVPRTIGLVEFRGYVHFQRFDQVSGKSVCECRERLLNRIEKSTAVLCVCCRNVPLLSVPPLNGAVLSATFFSCRRASEFAKIDALHEDRMAYQMQRVRTPDRTDKNGTNSIIIRNTILNAFSIYFLFLIVCPLD